MLAASLAGGVIINRGMITAYLFPTGDQWLLSNWFVKKSGVAPASGSESE